ncbi:MAG: tyrosine-type recombinase/integrase [Actinobacteria bacterium]|nr:tyrosine-type recombinase/integrase [Actinomycetota bacterium]
MNRPEKAEATSPERGDALLPALRDHPSSTPAHPADLPDTERLIAVYLRTLTSPQTIRTYNTEIRMFVAFLVGELGRALEEVTVEDLSLYRERLLKAYAPATAAKKLAALRRFLTFAYMGGVARINPEALRFFAKSPKVGQDPSYNVLTEEELGRMLSAARAKNMRDYVLLAVLAGAGLREAEVVGLKVGDFREAGDEGQVLLRVMGKGAKIRAVPVSPELWRLVQRHVLLSGRSLTSHTDAREPLFTSREGGGDKPLTTRAVRYIVKKYANAAGITKAISPHSIRHTVGTNMAVNEAPLLVIQQFLGHSDPKTTMRYVRRAEELASKAYTYNTLPL